MLTALIVGACGDGGNADPSTTRPGASDASSTAAPPTAAGDPDTSAADPARLAEFRSVIDATIALPRLSYELEVLTGVPEIGEPVGNRSTGRYDVSTATGDGTREFDTDHPAVPAEVRGAVFEFRAIGDMLWMLNPIADTPSWSGFDRYEFSEMAGGDALASVYVAGYLQIVSDAATEVVDSAVAAGTTTWTVRVRADDLLPMVSAAGAGARLEAVGAADSGLAAEVVVTVAPDGLVSSVAANLDAWWANAMREASSNVDTSGATMRMEMTIGTFDGPLDIEPPCTETDREVEDGVEFLTCPAA